MTKYVWVSNEGKKVPFSTHQVWQDFRINIPKVTWSNVIWFKGFDPKHAFILWLVVLNRLSTQDRMSVWMPNQMLSCVFCDSEMDSVKHLFFKCSFSMKVWSFMKMKLEYRGLQDQLNEIVHGISIYPCAGKIWNVVNRLVVAACVYFLWQERNHRMFRMVKRTDEDLCKAICCYVQCKLLTFRVNHSEAVKRVARYWDLQLKDGRFCI
ncbi:uncharacterized protein [Rutidosis leptorrhynchoides]|uniref:uncharacterized protein n=1 Tax=Rutidosis leptorrhynchoides TaxID=125765 RepID=UPI003A99AAE9